MVSTFLQRSQEGSGLILDLNALLFVHISSLLTLVSSLLTLVSSLLTLVEKGSPLLAPTLALLPAVSPPSPQLGMGGATDRQPRGQPATPHATLPPPSLG
jgi:hypothetical protein